MLKSLRPLFGGIVEGFSDDTTAILRIEGRMVGEAVKGEITLERQEGDLWIPTASAMEWVGDGVGASVQRLGPPQLQAGSSAVDRQQPATAAPAGRRRRSRHALKRLDYRSVRTGASAAKETGPARQR